MKLNEIGENLKYVIEEIFNESKTNKEEIGIINTLLNVKKFNEKIDLLSDEKYNLYYKVDLTVMIKNNLEDTDLFEIFSQGWVLSEDKKYLIKKI